MRQLIAQRLHTRQYTLQIHHPGLHHGHGNLHIGATGPGGSKNSFRTGEVMIEIGQGRDEGDKEIGQMTRSVRKCGCVKRYQALTVIPTSATHRSPMAKPFTFLPIFTIDPMASWPGISFGYGLEGERMQRRRKHTGNLEMNSP